MTRFTPPITERSLVDFSRPKSAADPSIGISRPDIVAHLCSRRMHRMSSMVPRKRRRHFIPFVVEGELVWRIDILFRIFLGFLFHARPLRFSAQLFRVSFNRWT